MKRNKIIVLLLLSMVSYATAQSKDQLKEENQRLSENIKVLQKQVTELKKLTETTRPVSDEAIAPNCRKIISDNNRVFFKKIFESNYKKNGAVNQEYYQSIGLADKNDTENYANLNVLLANLTEDDALQKEDRDLARKTIAFNNLYIEFYRIVEKYKSFFDQRYDETEAENFRKELDILKLSDYKTLNSEKELLKGKISQYAEKTCALQKELGFYKSLDNGGEPGAVLTKVRALGSKYKSFAYLQKMILKAAGSINTFDIQQLPCPMQPTEKKTTNE